jgi:cell division protein FtsL
MEIMRLFAAFLLAISVFGQSEPPSPAPRPAAHASQKKAESERSKAAADEDATKQLTSAINRLTAEIASENEQRSRTPNNDKPPSNWWAIANSILITLFTAVLAVVAVLQWRAMDRQANIADRQTEIADKQTEIAEEQLELTKTAQAIQDLDRFHGDNRYAEQLALAKENAATTKQTADAALLNARAVINSERPWIVVSTETPSENHFCFKAKCYGRTPAKIIENYGQYLVTRGSRKLPLPPQYQPNNSVAYPRFFTRDDGSLTVFDFPVTAIRDNNQLMWEPIANLNDTLWFFGKIVYTDPVSKEVDGSPILHVTSWCFSYSTGGYVFKDGPPDYNIYT